MKRLIAAIVLLSFAVAVTVWTGYTFNKEMNAFEESLNKLMEFSNSYGDGELIAEAEKIVNQWNKSSSLLRSVVLHDGVDELGRNISSLPRIIEHSGKDEMELKCIEAINLIKNLKACEKLSLENVL